MATRVSQTRTLFIRNLPYSTTSQQLESIFGSYGTLKKCFVVKNKGEGGDTCRGFGYVSYTTREAAVKAKTHVKVVSNRPVQIIFARGKGEVDTTKEEVTKAEEEDGEEKEEVEGVKGGAYDIGRTIIITQLSENTKTKQLRVRCRKIGPVETIEYPVPGKEERTASVTFKTHKDARQALKTLQSRTLNGQSIEVSLLSKDIKGVNRKSLKKSRLIVRNISFKCTEDDLNELFSNHGSVISTQIVKNEKNKSLGYGFVQYGSFIEAQKAMKCVNGATLQGRTIAVDWVVPREQYKSQIKSMLEESTQDQTEDQTEISKDQSEINEDQSEINEDQSEINEDQSEINESGDDDISNDDLDTNEEEESEEEEEEEFNKPAPPSDVHEGKTLFVRNVPYDVCSSELFQVFHTFGDIKYCRPVLDPVTKKCKGSAFVQYKAHSSVEACVEGAKSDEGLWIGQDKLMVDIAVSKEELSHMKKAAKQEELSQKDSRNLYLLEEGYIDPLSEVGQEMSKLDTKKRARSLQERRSKLKNPHYFISKTRLSVRNLPVSMSEKKLKSLLMEHAGKHALIKQVKLIRSKDQLLPDGLGRPVGFGFVEFKDHNSALTALRSLNNNPSIFGIDKRPIVEFALEDNRALKIMKKRREKQAYISNRRNVKGEEEPEGEREGKEAHKKTNKRVEWQIKWKERRLKKQQQKLANTTKPTNSKINLKRNEKGDGKRHHKIEERKRERGRNRLVKNSLVKNNKRLDIKQSFANSKRTVKTTNQRGSTNRQKVHDKKRSITSKEPATSFNSKVSLYKNKLFVLNDL